MRRTQAVQQQRGLVAGMASEGFACALGARQTLYTWAMHTNRFLAYIILGYCSVRATPAGVAPADATRVALEPYFVLCCVPMIPAPAGRRRRCAFVCMVHNNIVQGLWVGVVRAIPEVFYSAMSAYQALGPSWPLRRLLGPSKKQKLPCAAGQASHARCR